MFAALGFLPTVGVLLGVLAAVVVWAAFLEQRGTGGRSVTRTVGLSSSATGPYAPRTAVDTLPAGQNADDFPNGNVVPEQSGSQDVVAGIDQPAAIGRSGRSQPVLVLEAEGIDAQPLVLGALGSDRRLAGMLFGAYVASGRTESSRVTGWITADGSPPSVRSVEAGDRMRGRASRIVELLGCDDDSRNWVTIDPGTDIALAIERRPPTDPTLAGLLHWWRAATSDPAQLSPTDTVSLVRAIDDVIEAAAGNPLSGLVAEMVEYLERAKDAGVGVRLHPENSASAGPVPSAHNRIPEDPTSQGEPELTSVP